MGLWPVGGWVSLVWANLAQTAYPPPGGGLGSGWVGGWVGGWMGGSIFTERTVVESDKIFRSAGSRN